MSDPESFEAALVALEAKVEELARGDMPLERALAAFESGLALYRQCHEMLDRAEQRVTKLVATTDGLKEEILSMN